MKIKVDPTCDCDRIEGCAKCLAEPTEVQLLDLQNACPHLMVDDTYHCTSCFKLLSPEQVIIKSRLASRSVM